MISSQIYGKYGVISVIKKTKPITTKIKKNVPIIPNTRPAVPVPPLKPFTFAIMANISAKGEKKKAKKKLAIPNINDAVARPLPALLAVLTEWLL